MVQEKIVYKNVMVPGPLGVKGPVKMPGLISGGARFYPNELVPKIVHFTWYSRSDNKRSLRFHHYISVLAALTFIQPDKIMFWYERTPEGDWWNKIKGIMENKTKLEMIQKDGPKSIYDNPINTEEHMSDLVRLEALINHGGIYMDLDVITLRPLDDLLKHDVTIGYEKSDYLCNGFMMAKPKAPFLKLWWAEYVTFDDKQWNYHSVKLPGILAKNYPDLVHTEWDTIDRPNWEERRLIYNAGVKYDWSKNYAMHLWYRFYNKDHNPDDIKTLDSTLGEICTF
jgi:hypothetical protein